MIYMTLPFENDTSLLLLRLHLRVHYYLQLPFMDLELHRKQKI